MIDPIVNDPLAFRRERPTRYSGAEVEAAMQRLGLTDEVLAAKWRISPRTVRRMRDDGAEKASAAALNAELRMHFYRAQLYQRTMLTALAGGVL